MRQPCLLFLHVTPVSFFFFLTAEPVLTHFRFRLACKRRPVEGVPCAATTRETSATQVNRPLSYPSLQSSWETFSLLKSPSVEGYSLRTERSPGSVGLA